MESVHKNFRNHKCDICDKEFNGETAYIKHIDQVHKNKRIHKCDCCHKSFSQYVNYIAHYNRAHKELVKNFTCHICDFRTHISGYLKKHISRLHKEKIISYSCDICEKCFTNIPDLKKT